ncbi:glycogen debranching protein GlgX [Kineococcus sp. SYSU DK004]|uniref:glycogen debranching protein GlgX n=1 Tax=Kineococcus sp. SYSU DK004 TaxID=3383125 RepID=UPI003D7DBA39
MVQVGRPHVSSVRAGAGSGRLRRVPAPSPPTRPARPHPLGVTPRSAEEGGGADVAVLAAHADRVEVCVFSADGRETRTALPDVEHGVWYGHVPDLAVGSRYGLRTHGRWDPERGLRHNPAKLLLDPWARGLDGEVALRPEVFGHAVDDDLRGDLAVPDPRDSAPHVPRSVVLGPLPRHLRPTPGERPRVPWADTVVYEAHVRGLTQQHPEVPEEDRGTYAALAHPAVVEHLRSLGVTTLELLPVHASTSEVALRRRGLSNYWGYNTLAFNVPHAPYATRRARAAGPEGVREEFRRAVRSLHAAGIEVLLDVVYNHTCEEGPEGPHLSFRGLDDATYYLRDAGGRPLDVTGCGNSLDFTDPRVVQFTLDSLRYWVTEHGVDGFRFDLMTTLARGRDGFTPDHPFLVALAADPVLADVKLVAEPWDVGPSGWRTGQFPAPVHEWNDRFRDGVRRFWLTDARDTALGHGAPAMGGRGLRELATRFAGSADTFDVRRGRLTSVNFVTAHDGFTLADLVSYDRKHNEANGEGNRDGSDSDTSYNHGVEGDTSDPEVLQARRRSVRNLMATLVLSSGVPMLTAGDEFGRSQGGNNNAYCQDGPVSWVDWDLAPWQRELLEDTRALLELRRRYPVLRTAGVLRGHPVREQRSDLLWFGEDGEPMNVDRWHEGERRVLQVLVDGRDRGEASVLVVLNGGARQRDVVVPEVEGLPRYLPRWSSAPDRRRRAAPAGRALRVAPWTVRVLASR